MDRPKPYSQSTEHVAAGYSTDEIERVVEMTRQISRETDPQAMISVFRRHTTELYGGDSSLSLSRRGLEPPEYRITRSTRWREDINPWSQPNQLPHLSGGLLAELAYGDRPVVLRDLAASSGDPAFEYLCDARSLVYLPIFDAGEAVNGAVRLSSDPAGFDSLRVADALLTVNLIGRATSNLLVARSLRKAYAELDREAVTIARIQRSLLPESLPSIPGLDVATSYRTAARAGGDYYDFFDLGDGRWGLLIADVSGHGTPAAVVMAMLRTMLHAQCVECHTPGELLEFANRRLYSQSQHSDGTFATAFYGVFDPRDRSIQYACAGHNPPLLVNQRGQVSALDEAQTLPLAVTSDTNFPEATVNLSCSDTLILYTDGITEAVNTKGEQYGSSRLLNCVCAKSPSAQHIIDCVNRHLAAFTSDAPQDDDQTIVALRILAAGP